MIHISSLIKRDSVSKFIALLSFVLLLLPKINLIEIKGQTAGLRIDDIALIVILMLFAFSGVFGRKQIIELEKKQLLLFCFLVISFFLNQIFYGRGNILYALRLIEYFIFFYIGIVFYKLNIDLRIVIYIITFLNFWVMILQSMGLLGGFSSAEGLVKDVSDRVIGLTGGPWEIGTLLCMFFAIIINYPNSKPKSYTIFFFLAITTLLIFLTGARVPLFAQLVCIFLFYIKRINVFYVFWSFLICTIIIYVLTEFDNPILNRSTNLLSYSNIEIVSDNWYSIDVNPYNIEIPETASTEDGDLSWIIRISKWIYAIKVWSFSYITILLGIGPGTCGTALDGSWVRILTEMGVVGFLIFLKLFRVVLKINPIFTSILVTISINMVFIDIHLSYKVMSFFFLSTGYFYSYKERRQL